MIWVAIVQHAHTPEGRIAPHKEARAKAPSCAQPGMLLPRTTLSGKFIFKHRIYPADERRNRPTEPCACRCFLTTQRRTLLEVPRGHWGDARTRTL